MDIYLDFLSPYAYLAWYRARTVLAGVPLTPRPVLLGPILGHHGQLGPAEIPPKRAFIIRDTLRRAAAGNVPLVWPMRHPFKSVLASKAVLGLPETEHARAVGVFFAAAWAEGKDIEDRAVVREVLLRADFDAEDVLTRAMLPETSALLRGGVTAAIERGVFGVPTLIDDDGELFFGDDQLERIAAKRKGEDPLSAEAREHALEITARPLAIDRRKLP